MSAPMIFMVALVGVLVLIVAALATRYLQREQA